MHYEKYGNGDDSCYELDPRHMHGEREKKETVVIQTAGKESMRQTLNSLLRRSMCLKVAAIMETTLKKNETDESDKSKWRCRKKVKNSMGSKQRSKILYKKRMKYQVRYLVLTKQADVTPWIPKRCVHLKLSDGQEFHSM